MSLTSTARRTAQAAGRSTALENLTRAGLIGYGLLHLAVGWLALQIANGRSARGDQSGAFRLLAAQPFGRALVWAIAGGLLAMAIWQLFEAAVGHVGERGARRTLERIVSAGRTVAYVALSATAAQVAVGVDPATGSHQREATSGLLGRDGGPWLVGIVGIAVTVVGLVLVGHGITKGFVRHLRRDRMSAAELRAAVLAGQLGYAAKGAVYAVAGVLVTSAAITFDPAKSTGLDGALHTLAQQPLGYGLLLAAAAGFAVFGVYCYFQARYRKV
ncbi:DUF1206 domain-containing protein [Catellatospora bangladeshensis]|uniref:DUF1206 domain-containing protein n=1 Tax=Catellatospora bangladeshensis TaxID=310355 RepID=A0A8J3JYZ7_9ACTN|nr:DUF1206 domain-containing protein [Catellatospora bangladeshensis]GIF86299.1 hypothetical protein Cba03nite_76480 [Catellatospora bangladeshensis]